MKQLQKQIMKLLACAMMLFFLMPYSVKAAAWPQKVQGLKTGATTQNSINISWQAQAGVTGYQVYRSTAYDGKYKRIININSAEGAFCNKNLTVGKEYYYKVRAYSNTGSGITYGTFSKKLRSNTRMAYPKSAYTRVRSNIRKHAGTNHQRITTVNAVTKMNILCSAKNKSGEDWSYISCTVNGKTIKGYILTSLLTSNTQNPAQPVIQTGKVTAYSLNVRANPGTTSRIVGSLQMGQLVTILGQSKAMDGSTWYYVQYKRNGQTMKGYVSAKYIKLV